MPTIALDQDYQTYLRRKFPATPAQTLDVQVQEVLKYLYLASLSPGTISLFVTRELDDIWHALILETLAYERLCASFPSSTFIHHSSRDYPDASPASHAAEALQTEMVFYANYVHVFDGYSDETISYWPGVQRLMQAAELHNADEVNQYLRAIAQTDELMS